MDSIYIVTGTLVDTRTVTLDEALPLTPERVRMIVELLPLPNCRSYMDVMTVIRKRQAERAYISPTKQSIEDYVHTERDSWE